MARSKRVIVQPTLFYLVICEKNTLINQHCLSWILGPFWDKERPIICGLVKESHYLCISYLTQTKYAYLNESQYLNKFDMISIDLTSFFSEWYMSMYCFMYFHIIHLINCTLHKFLGAKAPLHLARLSY